MQLEALTMYDHHNNYADYMRLAEYFGICTYEDYLPQGYWYDEINRREFLFNCNKLAIFSRPVDMPRCAKLYIPSEQFGKQESWFESHLEKTHLDPGGDGFMFPAVEHIISLFVLGAEVRFWFEEWPEFTGKFVPLRLK